MALIIGNSLICIQDPMGAIKAAMSETLFDFSDCTAMAWKTITTGWTKDCKVKPPVNTEAEMAICNLNTTKMKEGAHGN